MSLNQFLISDQIFPNCLSVILMILTISSCVFRAVIAPLLPPIATALSTSTLTTTPTTLALTTTLTTTSTIPSTPARAVAVLDIKLHKVRFISGFESGVEVVHVRLSRAKRIREQTALSQGSVGQAHDQTLASTRAEEPAETQERAFRRKLAL